MKTKSLYKCWDIPSQHWYFAYAYSLSQADCLLRKQILSANGRYNYNQLQKVIK